MLIIRPDVKIRGDAHAIHRFLEEFKEDCRIPEDSNLVDAVMVDMQIFLLLMKGQEVECRYPSSQIGKSTVKWDADFLETLYEEIAKNGQADYSRYLDKVDQLESLFTLRVVYYRH